MLGLSFVVNVHDTGVFKTDKAATLDRCQFLLHDPSCKVCSMVAATAAKVFIAISFVDTFIHIYVEHEIIKNRHINYMKGSTVVCLQ